MYAGGTEQDTTVQITGQLFKILYACLDECLSPALNATVILNRSTSKAAGESSLLSPIDVSNMNGMTRSVCTPLRLWHFPCLTQFLKRPDTVVMSKRKLSLFIEEDKKEGEGDAAANDLRGYLEGGLPPGYQCIQCIPVATVAGCDLKFGLCDVSGNVSGH